MFKVNINDYVGKRYDVNGGDSINSFNCATLYRKITGIDSTIIPTCESGKVYDIVKAIKENKKHYTVIDEPIEGCIVALKRLKNYHHIGIFVDGGVLHAMEKIGVVYSSFDNLKLNGFSWEFGVLNG